MVFYRRRRRGYRRRTYRRRPVRRTYRRKKFTQSIHKFKRTLAVEWPVYDYAGITQAAGVGTVGYYSISQLPNVSEFTSLFDQYKITGISQRFIFSSNSQDLSATQALPLLGYVKDFDDATPLANENDALQYENYKIRRLDRPFKTFFRPKPATTVYNSAGFAGYARYNGWIDVASPGVQYYGLKWYIDPQIAGAGATVIGNLKIIATYYIKCKNVR